MTTEQTTDAADQVVGPLPGAAPDPVPGAQPAAAPDSAPGAGSTPLAGSAARRGAPAGGPGSGLAKVARVVLLATVVLGSLLTLPGFSEPVMLPKATSIELGGLVLLVLGAVAWLRRGQVQVPVSVPLGAAALVLAGMGLATLTAEDRTVSLIGTYSRYEGLAPYAGGVVLLGAVAVLYARRSLRSLTATLLVVLALVMAYGFLQLLGVDPVNWTGTSDREVFSTLGNTNFASAFVGVLVPVALAVSVLPGAGRATRTAAGVLTAAGILYAVLLHASQGLAGIVVGGAVVLLVRSGNPLTGLWAFSGKRPVATGFFGVFVVAGALVLAVFFREDLPRSLGQRLQFWQTSLSMVRDRPLTGWGLDSFGAQFLAHRPVSHAVERGATVTDIVHSVPLSMASSGGLVLLLLWLGLLASVGLVLLRGLRQARGARLVLLAGYGGGWLAYVVQSCVGVDVPPVSMLHFVTAGAVVALAAPPQLGGLGRAVRPGLSAVRPVGVMALALALLAIAATGQVLRPMQADAQEGYAREVADDDPAEALAASALAVQEAPWEATYARGYASRLALVDPAAAVTWAVRAAELAPGSARYATQAASAAEVAGDRDLAATWRQRAALRDPQNLRTLRPAGVQLLVDGRAPLAVPVLQRVTELAPQDASAWVLLGKAQDEVGDADRARSAFERAVDLSPDDPDAQRWLQEHPGDG